MYCCKEGAMVKVLDVSSDTVENHLVFIWFNF